MSTNSLRPEGQRVLSLRSVAVKTVLDVLPTAVALWNWEHACCWLNPAAQQLSGYAKEEVQREPSLWLNGIHGQNRALFSAAWERLRRGAEEMTCDYRFSPPSPHRLVWLREVARPVQTTREPVTGVLSLYLNITDLKNTVDAGGKKDHVATCAVQLLEGLVHELLNTLQNISIGLDLLHQTLGTPLEWQTVLHGIERASHLAREVREHCSSLARTAP